MICLSHFCRLKTAFVLTLLIAAVFLSEISLSFLFAENSRQNNHFVQKYLLSFKSGELLAQEGDYFGAIDKIKQSLRFADKLDKPELKVQSLMSLGQLFWNVGKLEVSSGYYKDALSLAVQNGLRSCKNDCHQALQIYDYYSQGKEYRSTGQHKKSIKAFQDAIHLAQKLSSQEHKLKCLRQLSITHWELNELQEYFSLNKQALDIAQDLNHRKEIGRCLNNIGLYHWKLENYSIALFYFEKALSIARNLKDYKIESNCLNFIGLTYRRLGSYDKALYYLEMANALGEKLQNENQISIISNNIGNLYRSKGLILGEKKYFYKALNYYEKSIKLLKNNRDKRTELEVLNNIGCVNSLLAKYNEALHDFQSGLVLADELSDEEAKGLILSNIGFVHFSLGNYEKSIELYKEAIDLAAEIRRGQILWEAYFRLGQSYEKLHKFAEALKCYQESVNVIDSIRSRIFLDTLKAGFVRDKLKVYECLIGLLYQLKKDASSENLAEEIFNIIEKAKSRAFFEVLGESRRGLREGLSSNLDGRQDEIASRISSMMQTLIKKDLSSETKKELLLSLQQAEDEYAILISQRTNSPDVKELALMKPFELRDVQNFLLDENTVLVEYFLGQEKSFLLIAKKGDCDLYPLPPRKKIEKSVGAYLKILSDPPGKEFEGYLASNRIFNEILYPFKNEIPKSVENLIIVPDGVLYYLPFETLIKKLGDQSSKHEFLLRKYRISYAPSSSSLLLLVKNKKEICHAKSLLVIGNPRYDQKNISSRARHQTPAEILMELYMSQGFDFSPLPYSKQEIKKISRYFPRSKRDIFSEERATEKTIKNISLEDYKIIHFACHGFLDEKFPFRSALVLSVDNEMDEDGFLIVGEIYNLKLSADLVVLSACQTGRGQLENIEGVLGLPRIFFYAGARSVISSLWKINDRVTTEFMSIFYDYLSQGYNITQALRLAKLVMLDSKFSHPSYWSPFVLNGDFRIEITFQ